MIGDWVSSPRLEHNGGGSYNHRLENITPGYEYDPIPLTSEILSSIGFADGCYMAYEMEDATIEICLTPGIPMYVRGNGWVYSFPHPKYVHELQHIMTMCGYFEINERIVL